MKNGFLYDKIVLPYQKDYYFKIPFYFKNDGNVTIFYSDDFKTKQKRFTMSKNKQFFEFKIKNDLDINKKYFLEYSNTADFKKVEITFKLDDFNINNNTIKKGNNYYTITKSKEYKNPILNLQSTKMKKKIDYEIINSNIISFELNITEKDDYKIILKDGIKTKTFNLDWTGNEYNHADVLDFKIEISYNKDSQKIKVLLINKFPIQEDKTLKFTGSLNKEVIWKKGEKEKEILFQKQIINYEKLIFNINDSVFSKLVINPNYFPTKIGKTAKGIRFDKPTKLPLKLYINTDGNIQEYIIEPNTLEYTLDWTGKKNFKLCYDDYVLIETTITKEKYLPLLSLSLNPLKAKISHPYYEDIVIQFKNVEQKYIIPSGKTEIALNFLEKGIRQITIENVLNAEPARKTWKVVI